MYSLLNQKNILQRISAMKQIQYANSLLIIVFYSSKKITSPLIFNSSALKHDATLQAIGLGLLSSLLVWFNQIS